MYCPKCKAEFIKGITECSNCGVPLVNELPPEKHSKLRVSEEPVHPSEYLNEISEWSKNMYNPGYYTGGNIPPHIRKLSSIGNLPIGIVALIWGIGLLGFVVMNFFEANWGNPEEILSLVPSTGVAAFFGVILVWAGMLRIRNSKK